MSGVNGRAKDDSSVDPQIAARRKRAFELYKSHLTYQEIADALDVCVATAWNDIQAVTADLIANTRDDSEKTRWKALQSLDNLERMATIQARDAHRAGYDGFYRRNDDGTFEPVQVLSKHLSVRTCRIASQTIMDCQRRRAKLIGLDAPTKHLIEIANVRKVFEHFNETLHRLIEKFVGRELRPQLYAECRKVLENNVRSLHPANLDSLGPESPN